MNSVSRRTGTYFHCSSLEIVRADQSTGNDLGIDRMAFTPASASDRAAASSMATSSPRTPCRRAWTPAGALHTPRSVSVRATTPATAPPGGDDLGLPPASGSATIKRGKYTAALELLVARRVAARSSAA